MRKLLQLVLFLIPSLAWAAGGACPSGASYINWQSPLTPVTLSSLGVTSCYYVSAAGSDSNAGTSESSPWLHAPGMPAATGNPASLNPTGGIGIIFRGGDTWHFGNSGASPYTGGSWTWSWNGTSSHPNYIGVDQTWFSGSSWARPTLTWDNPVTTSTTLGSCNYPSGDMFDGGGVGNYILDNFEMTGICTNSSNWSPIYVSYNQTNAGTFYYNLYIHGWSHVQFTTSGNCDINSQCMSAFRGYPTGYTLNAANPGDVLLFDVVDGADSDPVQQEFMFGGAWDVAYSYFNNGGQFITRNQHLFHDNWVNNFVNSGHSNIMESVGYDVPGPSGIYAVYNNVWSNLYLTGPTSNVGFWFVPPVGSYLDFFNNIVWNAGPMQFWDGPNGNPSWSNGTAQRFNDTFQMVSGSGNMISCGATSGPAVYPYNDANLHIISSDYSNVASFYQASTCTGQGTNTTSLLQSNAQANAAGYTSSQTYVYSPTSGSSPTVGAGTNRIAAFCNALSSAAGTDSTLSNAASACQADTTYGAAYNSATHTVTGAARVTTTRPSSGAWDIGAYQFNGAPPPAAPVASVSPATLAFGNQATSTTGGPLPVTLSNTGNASLIIASIISSSGEFAIASNTCPPSLAAGQNCTVTVTFTPNALGAQNGTLTFTDNSSNVSGSQQTVALTGTGTSPGLWTTATSTPNFTVSWSSAGTTQTCTATQTITASQPAVLVWWGWLLGSAPTFNTVSGDSLANIAGIFQTQAAAAGGKYMFSGGAYEASAAGGSTTGSVTINTTSASGSFDCDIIQPVIATGTAILDGVASVGYQGCTGAVPCVSPTVALSGNDYALVWGAKGNPAPTAPAAPWTTPADIDTGTNQYGGAFGALNQSVYSGFTFGGVSSTDYESISALSFGQSAALTVAVSPSGAGTLSQCSSGNYPNGKQLTCTITPASGYVQSSWSGVSGCSGNSCTFNMNGTTSVTAILTAVSYTLTQVISPASSGTVSGLNCGSGMYASGTSIGPCTATPAASYAFAGWSGGGCSGTSICTIASLSANTTLTATFTPTGGGSYTWTPTISPVAGGALTGTNCAAGTYTSGTTIGGCTAVAATGYTFNDWSSVSGSAGCSGATNPCASFVISANSAATANFTQTSYTLGATTSGTGSGTATPSSTSLHYGDAYTITVTPASGSVVDSVTGCGVSSQSPYTGTMPAATCSVQVVFDVESFSWTTLILPPGSGSITGTNSVGGTYVSGTDIGALTPTPSTGYIFSSWTAVTGSADCSGSTTPCTQFALDANSTATANFTAVNSTISVSTPGGGGTVTGCAGSHAYGSIYSCAATPAANHYLQSISGCGGSGGTAYSGATPATDCNIIATFGVVQAGGTATQMLESQ